jgi:hypothetical protein
MSNYNTATKEFKVDFANFSDKLCIGLGKVETRLVRNVVGGIIASQSSIITKIARGLKEKSSVKKVAERLARGLKNFENVNLVFRNYLNIVKNRVSLAGETLLLIDGSDIAKPHGKHMECRGSIKDASTGKFVDGYWTAGAVLVGDRHSDPIPVYEKTYPCTKQGGEGSNAETDKLIQALREDFPPEIPRVMDRAYDSFGVMNNFYKHAELFMIRVAQPRKIIHNGKNDSVFTIANRVVCNQKMKFKSKTGKIANCKNGSTIVTIPDKKNSDDNIKVRLVVCKEFGESPLFIYTNILDGDDDEIAVRVVKAYLKRWRIEEYHKFKKQGFGFEDFRVRSFSAINTLDLLLTIACGYIALLSETIQFCTLARVAITLSAPVTKIRKYLKETKFLFYAISDGLARLLALEKSSLFPTPPPDMTPFQQLSFY